MMRIALLILFSAVAVALIPTKVQRTRVRPLNENFFLDIGEDPEKNTPKQLYGEVAYKSFVQEYNPTALVVGEYDVIDRVRALKLLTLTAESGLLEALEARGLTLAQVEKLLPLVDDLGLLPLVSANKGLIVSLLPFLVEPAPLLLPLVVSILKTSPSTFTLFASALTGYGAFEFVDSGPLGVPALLLALPLFALGSVLSGSIALPSPGSSSSSSTFKSAPASVSRSVAVSANRPRVSSSSSGGSLNGKRTLVKVKVGGPIASITKSPVVVPKVIIPRSVAAATPVKSKPAPAPKVVSKPTPAPVAKKAAPAPAPKVSKPTPAPAAPKVVVKVAATENSQNGKRKVVKISK